MDYLLGTEYYIMTKGHWIIGVLPRLAAMVVEPRRNDVEVSAVRGIATDDGQVAGREGKQTDNELP